MESDLQKRNPRQCRACDNIKGNNELPGMVTVYQCAKCSAIFGSLYLGESYSLVLPRMAAKEVPVSEWRYFDFTTVGSAGLGRRHGWFDPASKLITQVG